MEIVLYRPSDNFGKRAAQLLRDSGAEFITIFKEDGNPSLSCDGSIYPYKGLRAIESFVKSQKAQKAQPQN